MPTELMLLEQMQEIQTTFGPMHKHHSGADIAGEHTQEVHTMMCFIAESCQWC